MKNPIRGSFGCQYWVSALIVGGIATFDNYALCQVVQDTTLGAESSQVTELIPGGFQIDGGATRGTNLFHSFQEFFVPTNGLAHFNNTPNIENILARVTGASVSNIDGTIRANGTANVFLINPNGIVFGPNARLEISGSFFASTANGLVFGNGFEFSATNPQAPPLLTINVPLGVQFGGNPRSIQVQGSVLQVPDGKTLALVGGNVQIDAANLLASEGRVELAGVGGSGTLGLEVDGNNLRLSIPDGVALGDVSLSNAAFVDVSGDGGGNIQVQGSRITLTDGSGITADTLGSNNGGGIFLRGSHLSVTDGSYVSARTLSTGQGGTLSVNTSDSVELSGTTLDGQVSSGLYTQTEASGAAGNLTIATRQLMVRDGAVISSGTGDTGQGGNLSVNASDSVEVSGMTPDGLFPSGLGANTFGAGAAGNLDITTRQLIVRDGGVVSAGTLGEGAGGNLTLNVFDSVKLMGIGTTPSGQFPSGLFTQAEGSGFAGNLTVNTRELIVQDGAQISASTRSNGRGGNLMVNASDSLAVIGTSANGQFASGLFTDTYGTAPGGNLTIFTGRLIVRDGAKVSASTFYKGGQGGTLAVNASESVKLSGSSADGLLLSSLLTQTQGAGAAGDLRIVTGQLIVQDGAIISSSSRIEGAAGNLIVNASGFVEIMGTTPDGQYSSGLFTQTEGTGDAGDLTIEARQLIVRDGALVSAKTLGQGSGGTITVNTSESVELIGTSVNGRFRSGLSASTQGGGDAGDLMIDTGRLILREGAQAATGTFGIGQGGDLQVNASDSVELMGFGSGLFTQTQGSGAAGNLRLDIGQLTIQAGARISTATFADGKGGDLEVNASESVELIGTSADGQSSSGLTTQTIGTGAAGNLRIDTRRLILRDGAVASAGTLSKAQGGILAVTASESVELIGTGSGLSTETKSSGSAGELRINTGRLIVQDEALVSARSFGTGQGGNVTIVAGQLNVGEEAAIAVNGVGTGKAGNIEVTSDSVRLENEGFIAATTKSGDGGNISLQVNDLLLMRHGSNISTTAGTAQAGGNGGNITIDAQFIVAVPKENSDITANAFTGSGGNINITTQGIYGLEFRPQLTPLSDITASSEFGVNGIVQIITPGVDITRGLAELPNNVVDATSLIDRRCRPTNDSAPRSSFTITGRGGLPYSPHEVLRNESVDVNWVTDDPKTDNRNQNDNSVNPNRSAAPQPSRLIEAQGWIYGPNGEVILTAEAPNATPHNPTLTPPTCPGL